MKGVQPTTLRKALRSIAPAIMFIVMLVSSSMPIAYARQAAGEVAAPEGAASKLPGQPAPSLQNEAPADFGKISPGPGATNQPVSLTLQWNASSGAATYDYCYSKNVCNNWTSAGTNTSASISGLSGASTYVWQVRANDGAGGVTYADTNTSWSFATGTLPGNFNKSSPADLATGVSLTPTLTWTGSPNATSYEYCMDETAATTCSTSWVDVGNVTSIQVGPLSEYTWHYWHVRAVNSIGITYSGNSSTAFRSFQTGGVPGSFTKTSPADTVTGVSTNPTLQWQTSANAASYAYCIDLSTSACDGNWHNNGALTSITISPLLSPNTTYYWHASATNSFGTTYSNGAAASFHSFTTTAAPGDFNKTGPSNGATGQPANPTLQWNASVDAASYEYCIDTIDNGACDTTWNSTGTNTSVQLSGLNPNTIYYWQASAVNASGTTYAGPLPASFWSFTTGSLPGGFGKNSPADGAANQPLNLTLSWFTSSGADYYQYCYNPSTSNCEPADPGWTSVGTSLSVAISGLSLNTTYYWHVRAVNTFGITYSGSLPTTFRSFTTGNVPGAFGKTNPPNGSIGRSLTPTLQWGASTGVGNYEYCIGISAAVCDPTTGTWTDNGTLTSISISGPLAQNTLYYWHVRAVNGFGTTYSDGLPTAYWTFTTGGVPGDFNKTGPANGATGQLLTVSLQWSTSLQATSYEYCLDIDTPNNNICNSGWIPVGNVTSWPLSLTASTTYYWQVRARDSFGTTDAGPLPAVFWSFTTGPLPGAFNKGSPADGATGVVLNPSLTWQPSANVTYYEYCLDQTAATTCSTSWVPVGNVTSVQLSGLSEYTQYYWHVRAVNSIGTTYSGTTNSPAAFRTFTTGGKPLAFGRVSPADTATGVSLKPDLQWTGSTNATSYEYCINLSTTNCEPADPGWINVGDVSHFTLTVSLSERTTYYWHVRSNNTFGTTYANASPAVFWSFKTGGKPLAFNKTSPASSTTVAQPLKPTLKWGASSSATSYVYCIDKTDNGACDTSWISVGNVTSKTIGPLTPSTTYYWQVRAGNSFGSTYANGSLGTFWTLRTAGVCPTITGWKGEYWANEALTGPALICRNDPPITTPKPLHFDWAYGSPNSKIPEDHFSARWTRKVNFTTAGTYRFWTKPDDGARLYIDGVLKGNFWADGQCCVAHPVTVQLTAGLHTIRLDYRENAGAANINLDWEQLTMQLPSIGAQDGWVLESGELSSQGGTLNSTGTTFLVGDDVGNRQYRSILSFNTALLPDNAVITRIALKIKSAGVVGTNPFSTHGNLQVDIRDGSFTNNPSLQIQDFQTLSCRDALLTFTNNPSGGWYTSATTQAPSCVSRTGLTQFRLRFQRDDNNDKGDDYIKFLSGNYGTLAYRPQLIITYWTPTP